MRLLLALLLLLAPAAGAAQSMEDLLADDRRVAAIGYRLATANTGLCEDHEGATGLLVHGLAQYSPATRPWFGFPAGASFAALHVADGSPAARAGLRDGDPILTVDGRRPDGGEGERASFEPVAAVEASLARALADGSVRIGTLADGAPVEREIRTVPACASRFQVRVGDRLNAGADGRYVSVTTGMIRFAANDDELALVLAHELAHNILRHRERLDAEGVSRGLLRAFGGNRARIRRAEDEADRLALYLMARAGYDHRAAPAFWDRYVRRTGAGIFSDGTHAGRRARTEAAAREVAVIDAQIAAGQAPTPDPPVAPQQQAASQPPIRR